MNFDNNIILTSDEFSLLTSCFYDFRSSKSVYGHPPEEYEKLSYKLTYLLYTLNKKNSNFDGLILHKKNNDPK